jgi:hypothetical protein
MQGIQKALGTCVVPSRKIVWPARKMTVFKMKPGSLSLRGKYVQNAITAIHSENAVRKRGMSCTTTLPSTQASFALM